ncbi:MAG: MFS transporter, partial [Gemmataceae bacterium]
DDSQNFLVFAFIGFVLMIAQGGLYRRFAGRMPDVRLLGFGVGLMLMGLAALGMVAYYSYLLQRFGGVASGMQVLFALALVAAVTGFAFVNPSISAMVSKRAPAGQQGEVQGVNQSFAALGRILGPMVGLLVFEWHASRTVPYAVAAGVLLLVVFLLPTVAANDREHPPVTKPPETP